MEILEHLLRSGRTTINLQDENGRTPLHFAVSWRSKQLTVEAVELMIAHGADVNVTDSSGDTPLHFAVRYGYDDDDYGAQIARTLIKAGARTNATNSQHKTPLDVLKDSDVAPFEAPMLFNMLGAGRSER